MYLIRLELGKDDPFWFLTKEIQLTSFNSKTKLFNLEDLTEDLIETIESSIKQLTIKAYDSNGARLKSVNNINYIDGALVVSTEDLREDTSYFEDIKTVTIALDDEIEDEEELVISAQDRAEAKKVLNKNGNTIKKYLLALDSNLSFLTACLEYELSNKNRNGIIEILNSKIGEFNDGT